MVNRLDLSIIKMNLYNIVHQAHSTEELHLLIIPLYSLSISNTNVRGLWVCLSLK